MKKFFSIILFTLLSVGSFAQTYTNDKNHSKLVFSVSHLFLSDVEGLFTTFEAKMSLTKDDFSDLKFSVAADVNSINTTVEKRDTHLKSADFFEAEKFPKLEFVSSKIEKVKGNYYKLYGTLSMHGISKPVILDLVYNGIAQNAMDNNVETYGFTITGRVSRMDYQLGMKFPTSFIGDEVSIRANVEFPKK